MQRIERVNNLHESLLVALRSWQAGMWTAIPGYIDSFDAEKMTVSVKPTIQSKQYVVENNVEGKGESWSDLPLLVDIPIVIQSAGGMSVTLPIKRLDECIVIFSSRCIDNWWQLGDVQKQAELRMHDLSDGFAILGPKSLPNVLANYNTDSLQIRSNDSDVVIDINPTNHEISITASKVTINAPLTINGDITTTGTITNNGHAVDSTHVHSGVTSGLSNTGVPT